MTTLAPTPTSPNDANHVFRMALQDLLQMGLRVAGVAARLAEVEGQAVEALATAATDAARVITKPGSMESAVEAARIADASDAARDAVATRVALIVGSFERAARAVRRTVALGRRIEDTRPLDYTARADTGPRRVSNTTTADRGDDLAERFDAPEPSDELGGRSTLEVTQDICRDLARAALPGEVYQSQDAVNPPVQRGAGPHTATPRRKPSWPVPPLSPKPDT
jgi:hypothetical protein